MSGWTRSLWVAAPILIGIVFGAGVDRSALPGAGVERIHAVFLLDGQSYFGHLEDRPWLDTVTLRDVYYLQTVDPQAEDQQVILVKRGTEVHVPADGMRIRRDQILGIERIALDSVVAEAIAVDRYLTQVAGQ